MLESELPWLQEALLLRVKDVDIDLRPLVVCNGKGANDALSPLDR